MAKSMQTLITMKTLGTPKTLSLNKKEWSDYLASTLNFFINAPAGDTRGLVIEAMKQYQYVHTTSSFKLSDKGKNT